MDRDIKEVLLTEAQIQARIAEMGEELTREYADKYPVVVGVLKGVVVFYADMVRQIKVPCEMDFMAISSYSGTNSTGKAVVKKDISADIKGRHVLILEDIYDTGNSLSFTYDYLMEKEPASIKICTLLDKPARRKPGITLKPDYVGFTIPDAFVVGYGLDFDEKYRNLPYVGILKPEAYSK
ncbi:MAG: hypoxanthine phosphoribosyltransferase [Oscillospiraceae bacterium]|nr:hypoxanthine phosphoribosyltransferase [Oscillospiraceae bacterium]